MGRDLIKYWEIPPEWQGETAFVVGGGPSLEGFDAECLRGHRVIVINNSWELAPWANILYFCDWKWWDEGLNGTSNGDRVKAEFTGKYVVTPAFAAPYVKTIELVNKPGLEKLRKTAIRSGHNGGYQAINLAYHLGAKTIVLLGLDMNVNGKQTHWHAGHPRMTPEVMTRTLTNSMLPHFPALADDLAVEDVQVINANPESAIKCWPFSELRNYL